MPIKTIYTIWNYSTLAWDEYYFKTSADLVDETDTKKIMTSLERTAISDYLDTFNAANKLLKLDASALIPVANIPSLSGYYLAKNNPTFTGVLAGPAFVGTTSAEMRDSSSTSKVNASSTNVTITAPNIVLASAGTISANSKRVINVANPTGDNDAANKSYVDSAIALGAKPASAPVDAVSLTNISVSATIGSLTIDGVLVGGTGLSVGTIRRILLAGQTTASENGIYQVTTDSTGYSFTKVSSDSAQGVIVFVEYGMNYNNWMFWNKDGTTWSQWSKPETITADNITIQKDGNYKLSVKEIKDGQIASNAAIQYSKLETKTLPSVAEGDVNYNLWTKNAYNLGSQSLDTILTSLRGAIRLLRGTNDWQTDNTQTISDAYDKISARPPVHAGVIAYLLSTENIATLSGSQTVDGVTSGTDGKLIILKNQTTASQNGVYKTSTGSWTKVFTFNSQYYDWYTATAGISNKNKVYIPFAENYLTLAYDSIPLSTVMLSRVY